MVRGAQGSQDEERLLHRFAANQTTKHSTEVFAAQLAQPPQGQHPMQPQPQQQQQQQYPPQYPPQPVQPGGGYSHYPAMQYQPPQPLHQNAYAQPTPAVNYYPSLANQPSYPGFFFNIIF